MSPLAAKILDLKKEIENFLAENARLNEELTATDTAWQNAEFARGCA